jgi:hypothetical protein
MRNRLRELLSGLIWTSLVAATAGALSVVVAIYADESDVAIALGLYGVIFALLSPSE